MPGRARLARSIARVETLPLPPRPGWSQVRPRAWLAHLTPSRRSLAVGLGVLAVAVGGYLVARESSLFAIDRIDVRGASPRVRHQVDAALASLVGKPLVGLDGSAVLSRVDALPTVESASYDRAFPHTLRVTVVPEQPAAVLRRGAESWLVSSRGRVIERLSPTAASKLPRIWISTHTPVQTGAVLTAAGAAAAARVAGLAGAFGARIASVSDSGGSLVFHLRSGVEVVLGAGDHIGLKVAVVEHVLAILPPGSTYLDVSNPGRPVSGIESPSTMTLQTSSRG